MRQARVALGAAPLWFTLWALWLSTRLLLPPQGRAFGIETLNGLAAAALLLLGPGLTWTALTRKSGPERALLALAASAGCVVLAFLVCRAAGASPPAWSFAATLLVLGSLPIPFLRGRGSVTLEPASIAAGAAAALLLSPFAQVLVPPLEDQDHEVQSTAWALATRQSPAMVTNRGTTYFFAHPPLLHFWVAGAFALAGELEAVSDSGRAALECERRRPFRVAAASADPAACDWSRLYQRFLARPHLWETRQLNVLATALATGLLAALAARLLGSPAGGLASAAVFATLPEVLLRGSYGGYFAITTLLTLLVLSVLARGGAPAAWGAGLALLADQKGLLAPAAWLFAAPRGAGLRRLVPLAGAGAGLLLFAAWGLALAPEQFVYDFVMEHVLRRLDLRDVRFLTDEARWYPSIPELWKEFAAHYGVLFTLAAGAASLLALRDRRELARAAGCCVCLGALAFSLTDWRQTKHLSQLAAPALLAIAAAVPPSRGGRAAWLVLAAGLAARNLATAWALVIDFESLRPSTLW